MPETKTETKALSLFPTIVRYSGLGIALYETFFEKIDRPAILALSGSMMLGSMAAEAYQNRGTS